MQEQSLVEKLRAFMKANHLSQKDVANAVNISQSTISRTLRRSSQRQSQANAKLFTYMQQHSQTGSVSKGKSKVVQAFESIWDGSEEHATAIAMIIKATEELIPKKREGEGENA